MSGNNWQAGASPPWTFTIEDMTDDELEKYVKEMESQIPVEFADVYGNPIF